MLNSHWTHHQPQFNDLSINILLTGHPVEHRTPQLHREGVRIGWDEGLQVLQMLKILEASDARLVLEVLNQQQICGSQHWGGNQQHKGNSIVLLIYCGIYTIHRMAPELQECGSEEIHDLLGYSARHMMIMVMMPKSSHVPGSRFNSFNPTRCGTKIFCSLNNPTQTNYCKWRVVGLLR